MAKINLTEFCQRRLKFCQSAKISSNLVTLLPSLIFHHGFIFGDFSTCVCLRFSMNLPSLNIQQAAMKIIVKGKKFASTYDSHHRSSRFRRGTFYRNETAHTFEKYFFKLAIPASFSFIFIFSNKLHNFYTKQMWKMSIQYMVLGFETTTFETWFSHNH